ncbi:LLM class flavin-dependent oxidoreductase [Rhodococcus qingshengii]|uniref:LLM class flavin-dependent oxidoreductase n=1 Tax=Rhodococcus qingshengii TaxID=334542 RepID=UPI001BE91E2B|nr:LLM class flavin-dependent oxidoreductase [Rhodococcus qingshengii]MBT2276238.1 LLM class flavin-dependent oxidoreductase [Rhodococcus qingshengii]
MNVTRSLLVIPEYLNRRQHEELAMYAEAAGLFALYHSELAYDVHAYEMLGLMQTERLRVGSGIAVRHKRHPILAAETAATLNNLFPGRYVLGLGSGVSEPFSGAPDDKLVGRMDEYITIIRSVLSGNPVEFHGKYYDAVYRTPSPHRGKSVLAHVPSEHIPIYVAGGGRLALRLAGRKADGVFIQHFGNRSTLSSQIRCVREAAIEAQRDPGEINISLLVQTCVDEDRDRARASFRNYLALYFERPYYRKILSDGGYPREAAALDEAWRNGGREAASADITDEVLDACGLAGTPEEVRARFDDFVVDGVDNAVLYPSPIGEAGPGDDWFGMSCTVLKTFLPEFPTA